MSVRRTVLAASVLALVFIAGASAKKPPPPPLPPPPRRVTVADCADKPSPDGERAVQHHAGVGRSQHQLEQLVVLHPARRSGLHQGRPAPDDVHVLEAVAGHDVQLLRGRDHLDRETLGRSNSVTYTTPADTTAPSAPTLSLTGTWPVRISVAWTASVDDVGSQVWYTLLVNGTSYGADQIGYRSALVLDRSPATTSRSR